MSKFEPKQNNRFKRHKCMWRKSMDVCKNMGIDSHPGCTDKLEYLLLIINCRDNNCLELYRHLLEDEVLSGLPTPCRIKHRRLILESLDSLSSREIKREIENIKWFQSCLAAFNETYNTEPEFAAVMFRTMERSATSPHNVSVVRSYSQNFGHILSVA